MNNSIKLFLITVVGVIIGGGLIFRGVSGDVLTREIFVSPSPVVSDVLDLEIEREGSDSASHGLGNQQFKESGEVVKVVDGDTIDVRINGQTKRLRYIGMNTPETVDPNRPKQCFGSQASEENKKLVEGQMVFLEKDVSETDKYGRLLRYVYLSLDRGGYLMVNDYLVRNGFANVSTYPPDVKYEKQFLAAEREAREGKRGLWGSCK
jgi:micrococcal nuclease